MSEWLTCVGWGLVRGLLLPAPIIIIKRTHICQKRLTPSGPRACTGRYGDCDMVGCVCLPEGAERGLCFSLGIALEGVALVVEGREVWLVDGRRALRLLGAELCSPTKHHNQV